MFPLGLIRTRPPHRSWRRSCSWPSQLRPRWNGCVPSPRPQKAASALQDLRCNSVLQLVGTMAAWASVARSSPCRWCPMLRCPRCFPQTSGRFQSEAGEATIASLTHKTPCILDLEKHFEILCGVLAPILALLGSLKVKGPCTHSGGTGSPAWGESLKVSVIKVKTQAVSPCRIPTSTILGAAINLIDDAAGPGLYSACLSSTRERGRGERGGGRGER